MKKELKDLKDYYAGDDIEIIMPEDNIPTMIELHRSAWDSYEVFVDAEVADGSDEKVGFIRSLWLEYIEWRKPDFEDCSGSGYINRPNPLLIERAAMLTVFALLVVAFLTVALL